MNFESKITILNRDFIRKYPNADMSKFEYNVTDGKTNITFGAWFIFGDSSATELRETLGWQTLERRRKAGDLL